MGCRRGLRPRRLAVVLGRQRQRAARAGRGPGGQRSDPSGRRHRLAPRVGAARCTTEVRNTHKTAFREITYRWHPWHGQRVLVRGEARRGGAVVLQCVRDELKGFPSLEIPEWMFDSHLCGQMKPAELPRVDCTALLALKHLLSAVTESSERDVVKAQHNSSSSGDADAQAVAAQDPSRRVVFYPGEAPRVARRSAAEDGPTAGQDVELTLAPPLHGRETGGGR